VLVRPESPEDYAAIRAVNRRAFGTDAEGSLVDSLRSGGYSRLSLVADRDGEVVGHILFSEIAIETHDASIPALALAPLAVVPEAQRRGLGTMLVREGLRLCREAGHRIVIVVGHPAYYPRFGFSVALAQPLRSDYAGPSFMALELASGALAGIAGEVRSPAPFAAF